MGSQISSDFKSSSEYDEGGKRGPSSNALFSGSGAWAPKTNYDPLDYLQVHLGQVYIVCAIAIINTIIHYLFVCILAVSW